MAEQAVISFELSAAGVAEVDRFFYVKAKRVGDLRGAWPATDEVFEEAIAEQFDTEGAHGGSPWPELASSTQFERARQGFGPAHPILVRTGELRDSFLDRTHPDAISEHGRLRWARGSRSGHRPDVHQRGSRDGRIPRRRIIELTAEDRHRLLRPVRNWVTGHDPRAGFVALPDRFDAAAD